MRAPPEPLTDTELAAIAARAAAATPGPWHVRHLDDDHSMNLTAVSSQPATTTPDRWPNDEHASIVAATLVQQPRYVDHTDRRWVENATFIAAARTDVPRLLAEITRLRAVLDPHPPTTDRSTPA